MKLSMCAWLHGSIDYSLAEVTVPEQLLSINKPDVDDKSNPAMRPYSFLFEKWRPGLQAI